MTPDLKYQLSELPVESSERAHDAFIQCANQLCKAPVPCNLGDTELVCPTCSSRLVVEGGVKFQLASA